ncbi:MAG: hypothetical protein GQ540_09370 [Lutibacter sp.]|uniref:hypothetical protein n=1 Tax=Lutibacter sp. TaxID=1925666 RepID=UPI0019FD89F3|nr:hypothetical protein [Lutibacter sp.]NOR28720.1 hypothetical protein [Lutibacter sp.]
MLTEQNSIALLQKVEIENLFQQLIQQLNKDFQLSNLDKTFDLSVTPIQLKEKLSEILLDLITNHYDDYLNFLYRVDVSENELAIIKAENLEATIDQITFLILKREYQKVWFKNKL